MILTSDHNFQQLLIDEAANHMMRGKWFKLEAMCREYWPLTIEMKSLYDITILGRER